MGISRLRFFPPAAFLAVKNVKNVLSACLCLWPIYEKRLSVTYYATPDVFPSGEQCLSLDCHFCFPSHVFSSCLQYNLFPILLAVSISFLFFKKSNVWFSPERRQRLRQFCVPVALKVDLQEFVEDLQTRIELAALKKDFCYLSFLKFFFSFVLHFFTRIKTWEIAYFAKRKGS